MNKHRIEPKTPGLQGLTTIPQGLLCLEMKVSLQCFSIPSTCSCKYCFVVLATWHHARAQNFAFLVFSLSEPKAHKVSL